MTTKLLFCNGHLSLQTRTWLKTCGLNWTELSTSPNQRVWSLFLQDSVRRNAKIPPICSPVTENAVKIKSLSSLILKTGWCKIMKGVMLLSQHGPLFSRNLPSTSSNPCHKEFMLFWKQKRRSYPVLDRYTYQSGWVYTFPAVVLPYNVQPVVSFMFYVPLTESWGSLTAVGRGV